MRALSAANCVTDPDGRQPFYCMAYASMKAPISIIDTSKRQAITYHDNSMDSSTKILLIRKDGGFARLKLVAQPIHVTQMDCRNEGPNIVKINEKLFIATEMVDTVWKGACPLPIDESELRDDLSNRIDLLNSLRSSSASYAEQCVSDAQVWYEAYAQLKGPICVVTRKANKSKLSCTPRRTPTAMTLLPIC